MALNFPVLAAPTLAAHPRPAALVNLAAGAALPPNMLSEARMYERVIFASGIATPADRGAIAAYVVAVENKNLLEVLNVATQNAIKGLTTSMPHINAKIANAGVVAENGMLAPVPNLLGGAPPVGFPATRCDLFQLDGAHLTPLENFYNLEHIGGLRARRVRLARAIGIWV